MRKSVQIKGPLFGADSQYNVDCCPSEAGHTDCVWRESHFPLKINHRFGRVIVFRRDVSILSFACVGCARGVSAVSIHFRLLMTVNE